VIRVVIVAASPLVRTGLQTLFGGSDVEVVGSIADFATLDERWPELAADVAVLEASGEQFHSVVESLAESRSAHEFATVLLSDRSDSRAISEALRAGARAVLPLELLPDQLIGAVSAAARGLVILPADLVTSLFAPAQASPVSTRELAEPLTAREREVLGMLAGGLANKQIASRLAISEHTVKFHVASILGKLGAGSRTEAVSIGIRRGLVLL